MNGWDVVSNILNQLPPIAMLLIFITIMIISIVGFSKHGLDFLRYGFSQNFLKEEFAKLATKEDLNKLETRIEKVETELSTIKVNHFGHLKDFLTELTSVLLDKGIFNNTDKTRLDNKLRDM